jgi:phosphoribosylformylglycinamidine synthase
MPFISGKDSLHNEYRSGNTRVAIPPTLLISALGRVPDIRKCVSMDLKEAGNLLFMVGVTNEEMGGSHYDLVLRCSGGAVPSPDLHLAPKLFTALHRAMQKGIIRTCHDLSEGGLAVAIAEMAFAGDIGATLSLPADVDPVVMLFSESCTRFLVEIRESDVAEWRGCLRGFPMQEIGATQATPRLFIKGMNGRPLIDAGLAELKASWQKPLRW